MARGKITIHKNENSEIYRVTVSKGMSRTEIPVSNTSEQTVLRTMRELFGRCDVEIIQTLPTDPEDGFKYTPELRKRLDAE